jgi:folylpolyglutamate synthase/dihydropteroate synthase
VECSARFPDTKKAEGETAYPIFIVPDESVTKMQSMKLGRHFNSSGFHHTYFSSGLSGKHQSINAALAVDLCSEFIHQRQMDGVHFDSVDSAIFKGLEEASWPGRAQVLQVPDLPLATIYLDGAHTPESLLVCAEWFQKIADESSITYDP